MSLRPTFTLLIGKFMPQLSKVYSWLSPSTTPSSYISAIRVFFSAIGYWFFGVIASYFVIESGFTSPIWPAAGFALLVGLRFGYWTLLGIFFGAFTVTMNFLNYAWLEPSSVWWIPFIIASGAVFQAAIAIWLVRRFVLPLQDLFSFKAISLFVLASAPVASIISASISVVALQIADQLEDKLLSSYWLNWWFADTIGVFIFCPVIISLNLLPQRKTKLFSFFVPYLLLIAVVITLFSLTRTDQLVKQQAIFDAKAQGMLTAIHKQTENILHASQTMVSIFSLFDSISFNQFQEYTVSIYDYILGTHALSWIPEVNNSERNVYEQRMSVQLGKDYHFTQRDSSGDLITATTRDRYYPVYYIAPLASNKAALGFDIGSHPGRRSAINHAFELGRSVATEPITLVQETEKQFAFLLLTPIVTHDERNLGLISAVYRAKELLGSALNDNLDSVSIKILDVTDSSTPMQFFENNLGESNIHWQGELQFAERTWLIQLSPTLESVLMTEGQEVWLVIVAGFIISTLMGLFLLSLINRKVIVENLVTEKTRALSISLAETQKAQQKIVENETKVRIILETVVDGIITFDVSGTIKTFNPAAVKMFGYTADEVLDKNVNQLMPEFDKNSAANGEPFLDIANADQSVIGREVTGKRKDGTEFPVDLAISEMVLNDQRMFTSVVRDITDRKNAKISLTNALKQADEKAIELQHYVDELSKSNQELDQYAYVASHDLKSPLQAIGQISSWIQADCADLLPEASQKHLQLLQQRIKRMENLLADLLAYSRIGRQEYQWENVNLEQLTQHVFELNCLDNGFSLVCETGNVACRLPRIPLELVLRNLVNNAIKHHDKSTGIIHLKYEVTDTYHIISICDDGPGIPVAYQGKALEMFQTLKSRDEIEGSGMGLALVKKTISFYAGDIKIISEGRGTCISTYWPKNERTNKSIEKLPLNA